MLGGGEVIKKLQTSCDELLSHGDEPFSESLTTFHPRTYTDIS